MPVAGSLYISLHMNQIIIEKKDNKVRKFIVKEKNIGEIILQNINDLKTTSIKRCSFLLA